MNEPVVNELAADVRCNDACNDDADHSNSVGGNANWSSGHGERRACDILSTVAASSK